MLIAKRCAATIMKHNNSCYLTEKYADIFRIKIMNPLNLLTKAKKLDHFMI